MTAVPDKIMALLPGEVRQTIGHDLRVHRNFDLVELCAGKTRILRVGIMGGLRGVAVDRV